MPSLTQEQADLLYSAILHQHDDLYSLLGHGHDHGELSGLADDDHTQYYNQMRGDARYLRSVPQQDHGGLAGLADDDHTQYYNQTRGDARYSLIAEYCFVSNSASLTVPNGSWFSVTYDREESDLSGWHSVSSNSSRITVLSSGFYWVVPGFYYELNVTGARYIRIIINGVSGFKYYELRDANVGDVTPVQLPRILKLNANDYITVQAYQTSGSTIWIDGISLAVVKIG